MRELITPRGDRVLVDDDVAAICEFVGLDVIHTWDRKGQGRAFFRHSQLAGCIMRPGKGNIVDHINGNTLDNRRENLQVISFSHNNMKKRTTEHPGVSVDSRRGRWLVSHRGSHGRRFTSLEAAKQAADAHRRSLGIKGMPLNFPEVGEHYWDGRERLE